LLRGVETSKFHSQCQAPGNLLINLVERDEVYIKGKIVKPSVHLNATLVLICLLVHSNNKLIQIFVHYRFERFE
jgi:hypothetical protein